jgi:hypothetical protein
MRKLVVPLLAVLFSGHSISEPLFIAKIQDDHLTLDDKQFSVIAELKEELKYLQSPDEVMLHIHTCADVERLAYVVNNLLPEYKSRVWVYGSKNDEVCK